MTINRDRLQALGFSLFLRAAGALGIERASACGERILRLIGPRSPRHRKVLHNLEIAFPERDRPWRERMAAAMWGEFGKSLAEYAYLPDLARESGESRVAFVDLTGSDVLRRAGQPIVFVAAHQANWNLPALVGQHLGRPLSVLYRRRRNPHLEAVIAHWRDQMPCSFIDVGARAPKAMLDALRRGDCIGLFIDRRSRDGEVLPFFGVDTPTPTIAARLALKTGAAFVPVRCERLPGVRFRISLHPPIAPPADAACDREAARTMTEAAGSLFESWIRERPEQWLSAAKRWPKGAPAKLAEAG
jgi:KDO2-lipid IV(A) lauroyltransferase